MSEKKTYSQTIKTKAELDISDVLKKIKDMKDELSRDTSGVIKTSSLTAINKKIAEVEKTIVKMNNSLIQGFSDSSQIQKFRNEADKLNNVLNDIAAELSVMDTSRLNAGLKQAQKEASNLQKQLEQVTKAQKTSISTILGNIGIKDAKDITNQLVESAKQGKKFKETTDSILNNYKQQINNNGKIIEQSEKAIVDKKEELKLKKEEIKLEKEQIVKNFSKQKGILGLGTKSYVDKNTGTDITPAQLAQVQTIAINLLSDENKKTFSSFENELKKSNIEIKNVDTVSKRYTATQTELNKQLKDGTTTLNTYTREAKEINKVITKNSNNKTDAITLRQKLETDYAVLTNDVFSGPNSSALKTSYNVIATAVSDYTKAQNKANIETKKQSNFSNQLNPLLLKQRQTVDSLVNSLNQQSQAQEKLDTSFDRIKTYIQYVFSLRNAFNVTKTAIKDTFNTIKELDKSFASIAMVTKYSVQEMWEQYDSYAKMAAKLGQSTKDVISSSALYYQQGI